MGTRRFTLLTLEELAQMKEGERVHLHIYTNSGEKIVECDMAWGKSDALNMGAYMGRSGKFTHP